MNIHRNTHGLRVQRRRVRSLLKRVDGLRQLLTRKKIIRHRKYTVKRPNTLWHLDGHHKMIRWEIIVHGFVDGFNRTVRSMPWTIFLLFTNCV